MKKESDGAPKLTGLERRVLDRLRRDGYRLTDAAQTGCKTLQKLVKKGFVRELPGIIDDCPQGYAPIDG